MNQSPPKASASSRPPAGASDGGRRVTALAAGGSVLLLSTTAVVVWPRTYGTEATFVLDGGAKIDNPVALAGRIEASLLERDQLASAAMDLPPELRSPDPIGRLRAGIRVQSRGVLGYGVEFRGSDPQSVQRIANRLVDRAVAAVPKLTASPEDAAPALELAQRTRAVTEFLAAHPEVTIEPPAGKATPAGSDGALDLLHTERRQIEAKLATGATDNPYADPADDPAVLARRLVELKSTIQRREAALKQPKPASATPVSAEVTSQWRALLASLADAQAKALAPTKKPPITAHVTARASLPQSPLTPNRLVLSIVAALLSIAAAMVAYVLPRKAEQRSGRSAPPQQRSDPPAAAKAGPSEPPAAAKAGPSEPPKASPSDAPPRPLERTQLLPAPVPRSDPPPKPAEPARPASEPPGPIVVQRPVVLSGGAGSDRPPATATYRRRTSPGGLEAPVFQTEPPPPATGTVITVSASAHSPPAAPLFGSRPPPGAGSYSVSSSHPPPMLGSEPKRTTVEHLSPLQSARPPAGQAGPSSRRGGADEADAQPQIMSRPPALDPEAERWAARFETVPPPAETATPEPPPAEEEPRKRNRWKTQVMGSMVPIEVAAAREGRPLSEPPSAAPSEGPRQVRSVEGQSVGASAAQAAPVASTLIQHDVPSGWRPTVDPADPQAVPLRDGVLKQGLSRRLTLAVTGEASQARAHVASTLAFALSNAGARVLLVEADFDNPQLHVTLALSAPAGSGFSQQLTARRHDKRTRPWTVVRCAPNLSVLAEGRLRSPGQLLSEEFDRGVRELAEQHHVVVLHAPALHHQVELRALRSLIQGVVIVQSGKPPTLHLGDNALQGLI